MTDNSQKADSKEECFVNNDENSTPNRTSSMGQCEEGKEQTNLERYTLLWCDAKVNATDDNGQMQLELRQLINFFKTFESADLCKLYIERKPDEEVILIVSGSIGKQLIPNIHNLSQVIAIYVFCLDLREHQVWAEKYGKVSQSRKLRSYVSF